MSIIYFKCVQHTKKYFHIYSIEMEDQNQNSNCKLCKQKLVPIGNKRKNGKDHNDWNTRQYHKKCYKIVEKKALYDIIAQNYGLK